MVPGWFPGWFPGSWRPFTKNDLNALNWFPGGSRVRSRVCGAQILKIIEMLQNGSRVVPGLVPGFVAAKD